MSLGAQILAEFALKVIKKPEDIVAALDKDVSKVTQSHTALTEILGKWDNVEWDQKRQAKQLLNLTRAMALVMDVLLRLLLLQLITVISGEMGQSAAHAANKLGRGQEALSELMKKKMGG